MKKERRSSSARIYGIKYFEEYVTLGVIVGFLVSLFITGFHLLTCFIATFYGFLHGVHESPLGVIYHDYSVIASSSERSFLVLVTLVAGSLVSTLIAHKISSEVEGSGLVYALSAYHRRREFIRFRVPFCKAVATAFAIGGGNSGGTLGPSLLMGSGIGSLLASILRLGEEGRRILMVSGISAALSSIFRTPLGATIFALEIPYYRDIEAMAFLPSLVSSIAAYLVSTHLFGFQILLPTISISHRELLQPQSVISIALLGAFSSSFIIAYVKSYRWFKYFFNVLGRACDAPHLRPLMGSLMLAPIGIFFPAILGNGMSYLSNELTAVIENAEYEFILEYLVALIFLKILATGLSIGSGNSGGLFAPGIFIGAYAGLLYAYLIGLKIADMHPVVYAYAGMAAVFGAATNTPLGTSIMVSEMMGNYALMVPSLIATIIAQEIIGETMLHKPQRLYRIHDLAEHSLRPLRGLLMLRSMRHGESLEFSP